MASQVSCVNEMHRFMTYIIFLDSQDQRLLHPGFKPGTSALGVLRATIAPVELLISAEGKSTIICFVMQKFHVFRFYLIVDD